MTTTVKTFKKPGAAARAAGDRPYLAIRLGRETLYVVADFDTLDTIELIGTPEPLRGSQTTPVRSIVAQVTLSHFERLGNANHAASDPKWNTVGRSGGRAFPAARLAHEPSLVDLALKWRTYDAERAEARAERDA